MIVIGYPGIGKSTVSKTSIKYVDFDSSLFSHEDEWWVKYVKEAIHLSSEGHVVFVSTHKEVQDELKKKLIQPIVIYPSLCLHDFWINKLQSRYRQSGKEADYRALRRCVQNYADDILELQNLPFRQIVIDTEDYDLLSIIESEL